MYVYVRVCTCMYVYVCVHVCTFHPSSEVQNKRNLVYSSHNECLEGRFRRDKTCPVNVGGGRVEFKFLCGTRQILSHRTVGSAKGP